jgi:hypothetical protein
MSLIRTVIQVHLLDSATARAFEAIVDLPSNLQDGKQVDIPFVSDWIALEGTVQPSLQVEELLWSEEICRKDPQIAKAARAVGVEPENLYVDGKSTSAYPSLYSCSDRLTCRMVYRHRRTIPGPSIAAMLPLHQAEARRQPLRSSS